MVIGDKVIGIQIKDVPPGGTYAFHAEDFKQMAIYVTAVVENNTDHEVFMLVIGAEGWMLWGAKGGLDDYHTPPMYTPLAKQNADGFSTIWGEKL